MIQKLVVLFFTMIIVDFTQCSVDESVDESDVSKRSRNPYSWMNNLKRTDALYQWLPNSENSNFNEIEAETSDKRAIKNPYSWQNYKVVNFGFLAPREPYWWMGYGEKRAPLNPYSWMYTLQKRSAFGRARNPYSWLNTSR
ncbi:unnamed protein product [Anisakis simplex]|uniref:Neuropeptide n=1 Tax=Anisakis simplex TaxID=6269 RepID=A0A0M3K7Z1_ANISI|nr:unnamed protein product [Anisakis simplex]